MNILKKNNLNDLSKPSLTNFHSEDNFGFWTLTQEENRKKKIGINIFLQ